MSIRWDFQVALRNAIATEVTVLNGYTYNLSGPGAVTNDVYTIEQRAESMAGDVQVQIEEGREDHTFPEVAPDLLTYTIFEVLLDCIVRGKTQSSDWRKELNDLVADLNKGIHQDPSVGGTVRRCRVVRVDEPTYHPNNRVANVVMRLVVEYEYQAGALI